MSEEEIIDIVKEIKSHQVAFYEPKEHKQILKNYFTKEQSDAIQGLLDLYQAEKEKNEELEMRLLEKDLYIDGLKEDRRIAIEEIQEEYYISKDKIKEKIEEYEEILQSSIIKEDYKKEVEHIIRVLEELK